MEPYRLTEEDARNIRSAIEDGGNIWMSGHISDLKRNIKDHYRDQQNEQCCYCKKVTYGEFRMVLDIEHILPKGNALFHNLMFEPMNLSVACKRCNMNIKNQDTSFISETAQLAPNFHDSRNYLFIHPHSDNYWDYINYSMVVKNDAMLIQYSVIDNQPKGLYTYRYFRLNELEVDSANQAQGVETEQITPTIDDDIRAEIRALMSET